MVLSVVYRGESLMEVSLIQSVQLIVLCGILKVPEQKFMPSVEVK